MSAPVIVQVFDEFGFTHLRAALDLEGAYAEDWVATVSYTRDKRGGLHVDRLHEVPAEVLDDFYGVAKDELRGNPRMDLSYLATHRYVDGELVQVSERAA